MSASETPAKQPEPAPATPKNVIPIDEDDSHIKVRGSAMIRVHVYLGMFCRSEMFDKSQPFEDNKHQILAKFGIGSDLNPEERQKERDKYVFNLVNGGVVDANNLVFHDDRVIIRPRDDYLKQQEMK